MGIEPLEDRRLLSITVNTLMDEADGSIVDGDVSFRDAIALAPSGDTIYFAPALTASGPATIVLTRGELVINKALTINGPGAPLLTIDASGNDSTPSVNEGNGSRVFNIDDGGFGTLINVEISGLTLTGGDSSESGGAIFSRENLTIARSLLTGNAGAASTFASGGGGIYSSADHTLDSSLTVRDSAISNNHAVNYDGAGIRIKFGNLLVERSVITGNQALGGIGFGGGISSDQVNVQIRDSTISDNSARVGGGFSIFGSTALITNSTISGNTANQGGGIYSWDPSTDLIFKTEIRNSTVSDNGATLTGGGVMNGLGKTLIAHSTITDNYASTNQGGGVASRAANTLTFIHSSIVAANSWGGDVQYVDGGTNPFASGGYNIIGNGNAATGFQNAFFQIGDQAGVANPMLGPLADNSGPTKTHALLAGSPAIDAGNTNISPPSSFEQRGEPFLRVADGDGAGGARIDIGPYERQTLAASHFVVDTLVDENDGDYSPFDRSLREAISLAPGSIGTETITFHASLTSGGHATITLIQGELQISDAMTINGPGAWLLTIDASGNDPTPTINNGDGSRIFNIDDGDAAESIDIAIRGLMITGGDSSVAGGAIFTVENLTVAHSIITGNATNIAAVGGGGGIYSSNLGSLIVRDSSITSNAAVNGEGGGIRKRFGSLEVERSTISGNSAFWAGGGISAADGSINVQVRDSTISGNTGTSGGIFLFGAYATIARSTINDNTGGGIATYVGTAVLDHAIVAGNTASGAPRDVTGSVAARYSLIGVNTFGGITDNGGNLIGTPYAPIDALLGPLADNGGPTLTHGLLPSSPAFNRGDPAAVAGVGFVPLYDQRGNPFARINKGRIDIGAFESNMPILVVDTLADENDGNFSAGDVSLREAIANSDPGDTITFVVTGTINLTLGELVIDNTVTIDGPGAELLTVDASANDPTPTMNNGDGSRLFSIGDGLGTLSDVIIQGLTLTGGDTSGAGGAIFAQENLTIADCSIIGNASTFSLFAFGGGAIYSSGANSLTVRDSSITGNAAVNNEGGGIRKRGGTLIVERSTISGNTASSVGGGISAADAAINIQIHDSTISGNTAGASGGGLFLYQGTAFIANSTINNNVGAQGGGIDRVGPAALLEHVIVAGNRRPGGGRDNIRGAVVARFTLIGDNAGATITNNGGNIIGTSSAAIDPLLSALANNGGPTMTDALLLGSPARGAGDPTAQPGINGVPEVDQRGAGFARVSGGRIDIGAFEVQHVGPELPGDYNQNSNVDGADYVMWRKMLGTTGLLAYSGADGDGDTTIDEDDYGVWRAHFGQTVLGSGSGAGAATTTAQPAASDAHVAQSKPVPEVETATHKASTSYHAVKPNEAVAPRIGSIELLAHRSLLPASFRPARRSPFDSTLATNRRDDALMAWLASQPDTERRSEAYEEDNNWKGQDKSDTTDLQLGSVDHVFELLTSD